MTSNKVNIFDFATSELSHDAILCYILKGINGVDFRLNEASKRLYKKIFKYSENLEAEKFEDICVKRQVRADKKDNGRYGIIDILVTLKYSGNPHVIVIEDKIDTDEHGNQLDIYSNFIAENFKDYTVKMVFITQKYKSILSKHRMNERG